MTFEQLELAAPILHALQDEGYQQPTPIQEKAIPPVLEGNDLLGCAQTGTGKTAAFALPALHHLFLKKQKGEYKSGAIQALVLTPTRELAIQVEESFRAYGRYTGLRTIVVYGGVSQYQQEMSIRRGADILVATPGRLIDLINQRILKLDQVQFLVLDEADRMLDMGFIRPIRQIIALLPKKRQNLFFSATMPLEIRSLADDMLVDPIQIEVAPVSSTAETVEQQVCFVERNQKRALLKHFLTEQKIKRALVFTRTKHGADKVTQDLNRYGITAEAIHGNKAQNARQKALSNFRSGHTRVLVATDIAARGIDVDEISHVINYELPNEPETYVHRIGRTGRAGARGIAVSFCDTEERAYLKDIQKLIRRSIPVDEAHPYVSDVPVSAEALAPKAPAQNKRSGGPVNDGNRPPSRKSNGNSQYWRKKRDNVGNASHRSGKPQHAAK